MRISEGIDNRNPPARCSDSIALCMASSRRASLKSPESRDSQRTKLPVHQVRRLHPRAQRGGAHALHCPLR